MDETIGSKGGHNDRIRTLKITQAKKKKLQEYEEEQELKELEKDVRKKQIYTLIKTIPIVTGIGAFKLLTDKNPKEKQQVEEEQELTEYQILEQEPTYQEDKPNKPKEHKVTIYLGGENEDVVYISLDQKQQVEEQKISIPPKKVEELKEKEPEKQSVEYTYQEEVKEQPQEIKHEEIEELQQEEQPEVIDTPDTFLEELAKSEAIEIFEVTE